MDRADLYRIYELGGNVHRLSAIGDGITLGDAFLPLWQARAALRTLTGSDPQVKIDICSLAAMELEKVLNEIERSHFWNNEKNEFAYPADKSQTIYPWLVYELKDALQSFEAVFRAEMQAASTYWVPKRGTHSTRDLVDAFDNTFLPELRATLGPMALDEYRSAGRCFAFGLWTAAGYHACRAVEAVLRPYYEKLTGKEATEGKTWGHLIEGLEKVEADLKPNEKTLFYIRQLKDNERNPLMHVRVVLDEMDADLLLGAAKIAMMHMARELIAIVAANAGKQDQLNLLEQELTNALGPPQKAAE